MHQDLIVFEFDEEDLYSRIECWSGGEFSWAVEHCAQRGIGDLRTSGSVPLLLNSTERSGPDQLSAGAASNCKGSALLVPRNILLELVGDWTSNEVPWASLARISQVSPDAKVSEGAFIKGGLLSGIRKWNRSWFHHRGLSPR